MVCHHKTSADQWNLGADGAKSVTRHLLGIEYKENTHIVLDEDIEFDVPTVYQNNLFVDIKAINGSCPPLAEEDKLYGNAIVRFFLANAPTTSNHYYYIRIT